MKVLILLCAITMTGCAAFSGPDAEQKTDTSQADVKLAEAFKLVGVGETESAEKLAKEALTDYTQTNSKLGIADTNFVLALVYMGDEDSAADTTDRTITYFLKSKKDYIEISENIQAAKVTFQLAQRYQFKGDMEKSCASFSESLDLYNTGKGEDKDFPFNPKFESPVHYIQDYIDGLCAK